MLIQIETGRAVDRTQDPWVLQRELSLHLLRAGPQDAGVRTRDKPAPVAASGVPSEVVDGREPTRKGLQGSPGVVRCGQVTPDGSRGLIVARGVCRGAVIHLREAQSAKSHGAGHGPQGGSHARRFTHTARYSGSSTAESRRPQPPFSGLRCARPTAASYTISSRSSAEIEGHAAPLERRGRRGENGFERDTGAGSGVEPALRGIPRVLRPMLAMPCRTIWRPCPRSARRQKKATKGDGAQIGRPGSSTAQVAHWSASLTHRGHVTQARRRRSSKEKAQSKGKSSPAPFTGRPKRNRIGVPQSDDDEPSSVVQASARFLLGRPFRIQQSVMSSRLRVFRENLRPRLEVTALR
ncbi:hypothetical protein HPB47_009780 [Ixodes persulcatus]|uniref:Uncharacterized protein n=1 Tax=Ixodes persulcatus TaxID=34615 RepID=A0AC60P0W5_IXOPE|nr:hypothetical protein HPB47_009780 [Ixodes persulcatus]